MENKNLEVFSDAPVPKAVLKNVLPAMAAILAALALLQRPIEARIRRKGGADA